MIARDVCLADVGAVVVLPLIEVNVVGVLKAVRDRFGMVSFYLVDDGRLTRVTVDEDSEVTFTRSHLRKRVLTEPDAELRGRLLDEMARIDALVVADV